MILSRNGELVGRRIVVVAVPGGNDDWAAYEMDMDEQNVLDPATSLPSDFLPLARSNGHKLTETEARVFFHGTPLPGLSYRD